MKKLSVVFIVSVVVLFACHSKKISEVEEKDNYERVKQTLEEKEKDNPLLFLTVSSHDRHNLVGKTVVIGNIINNAKICTYKDVELELSFYGKSGTLLEKDNETIYDEFAPGNPVKFKTKQYAPKGTDSVSIKIIDAKNK